MTKDGTAGKIGKYCTVANQRALARVVMYDSDVSSRTFAGDIFIRGIALIIVALAIVTKATVTFTVVALNTMAGLPVPSKCLYVKQASWICECRAIFLVFFC
jgi:hypothetical protein